MAAGANNGTGNKREKVAPSRPSAAEIFGVDEDAPSKKSRLPAPREDLPDTLDIPIAEAYFHRRAALALMRHMGDTKRALKELGFAVDAMTTEQMRLKAAMVFRHPAVDKIISADLADFEANKEAIKNRVTHIALTAEDPDTAVRAIAQISRMAGWNAALKIDATSKSLNIHTIAGDPQALIAEVQQMLGHEPGEAIAVQTDDAEEPLRVRALEVGRDDG